METEVIKEVVTGLSFWEQAGATVVGVTVGFVFSLALFWLKEFISDKKKKKHILECLKYEFEYNLNLYRKALKQVNDCITAVGIDSKNTYLTLHYELVTTFFAQQFYKEGLLLKYLHWEDMNRWNDMISKHFAGSDKYVMDLLAKWRESETTKEDIFTALNIEKGYLENAIEMVNCLKGKIYGG